VPVNFPTAPGAAGGTAPAPATGPAAPAEADPSKLPTLAPPAVASPQEQQAVDEAQEGLPGATVRDPAQQPSSYEILKPVIQAAIERIETKTEKAFTNHAGKPGLVPWSNVFATEQAGFISEVFAPIHTAAVALKSSIDVAKLSARYEAALKRRGIDGTVEKLQAIFDSLILTEASHG